jgi:VWFA-related protein
LRQVRVVRLAPIIFLVALETPAQEPRQGATDVFGTNAQVVVLDVVTRDKRGHTIRDLRPDEIQVFEEGVRKDISSFRFVATAPTATEVATLEEIRHPNLVTLVFDQLGSAGRLRARQAAEILAAIDDRPDLVMSVFRVGRSLDLVQQFTNERDLIRSGIRAATNTIEAHSGDVALADITLAETRATQLATAMDQAASNVAAGPAGALAAAGLGQQFAMANMAADALKLTEELQRQQQGHASLFSLLALAKQQQRLGGRKTIVYFSEGLQVPPNLEQVFLSAISEANRGNVSFYAVDVRGLESTRSSEGAREALQAAAEAGRRQMVSAGRGPVTRDEVMIADTAQASLRSDVAGALGDLSESTGGRLISDTNDLSARVRQVVDDLSGFYELVYDPQLREFDGKFRHVTVKVSRPGAVVQTRTGYFALPPGEGAVQFPYELPLLAALRAEAPPHDFDFRTTTYRFGHEEGGLLYTLVMEVPLQDVAFEPSALNKKTLRAHFSMMAVVRDDAGNVVQKFSQDSPVEVPESQREALRLGNAVFTRSFRLPPGRFRLDTVAMDQTSRKTSVRRSEVVTRPDSPSVELSNLAVVKRLEPITEGALAADDLFRVGSMRIVPHLAEARVAAADNLSVYMVAYPKGPLSEKPTLLIEFERDGAVVGRSAPDLPAADAAGRVPYLVTIPARTLGPGHYEVTAVLRQGRSMVQERTTFTIDE